ncbi:MAG: hypothetical protein WCH79_16195 [Planctomycetia bacterium]
MNDIVIAKEFATPSKSYRCTDGFVTKTIEARSAQLGAEGYALVSCDVEVVEVDADGNAIGEPETISIQIA